MWNAKRGTFNDNTGDCLYGEALPGQDLHKPKYLITLNYIKAPDICEAKFTLHHRGQTQVPTSRIRPSTLFYLAWRLVSTRRQRRAPCPQLRSSYMYTVLKLHPALWRQLRGGCGPQGKWVWHPLRPYTKYTKTNQSEGKYLHKTARGLAFIIYKELL